MVKGSNLSVLNFFMKETDSIHSQNIRSKKILERISKYLNQVGRINSIKEKLKEESERGVLPI